MEFGIGCCCRPKVNYRVFDFTNGTLLWEKLLYNRLGVGMDGRVWHLVGTPVLVHGQYQVGVTSSVNLPARVATHSDTHNLSLYSARSYNGETGEIETESPPFVFGANGATFGQTLSGYIGATQYTINSSGQRMLTTFGFAGTVGLTIVNNLTTGPVEYYFNTTSTDAATLNLVSEPASSTAAFSIHSSASAVQAAISSAFSGLVNSVSVTSVSGTNIFDGLMKVVIDWTLPTSYLKRLSITGRVQNVSGSIQSLETGSIVSRGGTGQISSSYSQPGIWLTETKQMRISAHSSSATRPIVECWDVSTNPWTLKWTDDYTGSHATWVPGESEAPITLAARNGTGAMSVAVMGATPFSMRLYQENGTVIRTNAWSYYPRNLALSDDSAEVNAMFLQWGNAQRCAANGLGCTNNRAYVTHDGAANVISPISSLSYTRYNIGANNNFTNAGFNSEAIAAIQSNPLTQLPDTVITVADSFATGNNSASILIDTIQTGAPSGLSNPFAPSKCYESYWLLSSPHDVLVSTCQWRLRFLTSTVTDWFDEDATMSDLNASLLAIFGSDIDDRQNVTASTWNTLPTYKANMIPMVWQQYMEVFARCARNSVEAAESGMNLSLSANVPTQVKQLRVEVRQYVPRRTATISALSRSDGSEIWSRGFSAARPDSPCSGVLHSGNLYCATSNGVEYRAEL